MSGLLDTFDDFYPSTISKKPRRLTSKQIRNMNKKQLRRALHRQTQSRQRQRQHSERVQEQGMGLVELVKSKEFKQRVELVKRGSKLVYDKGTIAATKLASRIKRARRKNIYD